MPTRIFVSPGLCDTFCDKSSCHGPMAMLRIDPNTRMRCVQGASHKARGPGHPTPRISRRHTAPRGSCGLHKDEGRPPRRRLPGLAGHCWLDGRGRRDGRAGRGASGAQPPSLNSVPRQRWCDCAMRWVSCSVISFLVRLMRPRAALRASINRICPRRSLRPTPSAGHRPACRRPQSEMLKGGLAST